MAIVITEKSTIDFKNITQKDLFGDGWFDQFLITTRIQLDKALDENRITQDIYGQIIAGAIPSMMAEAVKFELQRELMYWQGENERLKLELLLQDREMNERRMRETEKTGEKNRELIDQQVLESIQKVITAEQAAAKVINDNLAYDDPDKVDTSDQRAINVGSLDTEKATEVKERTMVEAELTGIKDRLIKDEQIKEAIQAVLTAIRKVRSHDDNLLLEITKMQSNVASFFVNASPDNAQDVLDELRCMMQSISARAVVQLGTQPVMPPNDTSTCPL